MPATSRRGFILPTTLLVMTLLTVMLTAAFILASAEFRATDNTLANSRALAIAEAGLEGYYAQQRNLDTGSTYDSVRLTFSSGYADIVGRRIRPASGSHLPMWLIRSLGTATDPRQPGQAQGQRAVAQLAELSTGTIPARAAITAVNGILMYNPYAGTTNPISGTDFPATVTGCTDPGSPTGDTAAYAVSTPAGFFDASTKQLSVTNSGGALVYTKASGSGTFGSTGNFSNGQTIIATGFTNAANNGVTTTTANPTNTMPVARTLVAEAAGTGKTISAYPGNYLPAGAAAVTGSVQSLGSISAAYDSTHIDWADLLSGDFTPDFTNTLPATCTGASCVYSSYYWTTDVHVPAGSRRMLLISTGNVYLDSGAHVDGIIIAGGAVHAYGNSSYIYTVHGMVISGLNCGPGTCPAQDTIMYGSSSRVLRFSWCYAHAAVGDLNAFKAMRNTWVDTWSLY